MINRFLGKANAAALRQAILDQQCVCNDGAVADEVVAAKPELVTYKTGEKLTEQGGTDNHICLILGGRVAICVNGRELAVREGRQHVGEMALIEKGAKRSATIIALEETVVLKVAESVFSAVANKHPDVWRRLALELGNRLRERSKHVRAKNPRPMVFIGCSVEGLSIAEHIQLGLRHEDMVVQIWKDNLFVPGSHSIEALEERVTTADFGVLVCTPDDRVTNPKRKFDAPAPRDNVILELGMCLGSMGRQRAYLVRPRGGDLKIPTDMLGITPIDYNNDPDPKNLAACIGPVCTQIKLAVKAIGAR